jgi:Fe-S cluster assembly ATPase SufC
MSIQYEVSDAHNMSIQYEVSDAHNVTSQLTGERWAIVGPNGTGKSTLLKAITGQEGAKLTTGTLALHPTCRVQRHLPPLPSPACPLHKQNPILVVSINGHLLLVVSIIAHLLMVSINGNPLMVRINMSKVGNHTMR